MKYVPIVLNRYETTFLICEECGAVVPEDKTKTNKGTKGSKTHDRWHRELRMRTS